MTWSWWGTPGHGHRVVDDARVRACSRLVFSVGAHDDKKMRPVTQIVDYIGSTTGPASTSSTARCSTPSRRRSRAASTASRRTRSTRRRTSRPSCSTRSATTCSSYATAVAAEEMLSLRHTWRQLRERAIAVVGGASGSGGLRRCAAWLRAAPGAVPRARSGRRAAVGPRERAAVCLRADVGRMERGCTRAGCPGRRRRRWLSASAVVVSGGGCRAALALISPPPAVWAASWLFYQKRPK